MIEALYGGNAGITDLYLANPGSINETSILLGITNAGYWGFPALWLLGCGWAGYNVASSFAGGSAFMGSMSTSGGKVTAAAISAASKIK